MFLISYPAQRADTLGGPGVQEPPRPCEYGGTADHA